MARTGLPDPVARPPTTPDIDHIDLERDLAAKVDGEVRFDTGSRGAYSTDASNRAGPPTRPAHRPGPHPPFGPATGVLTADLTQRRETSMKRQDSQVVVITGGSAGIGRATARAFAARGAHVALLARGESGLEGAANDVERAGGRPLVLPTDVADFHEVDAAADRVENELGPIDVWINNAFTAVFAPFMQTEPAEYKRVTEVTYLGYVYGTRAALSRMLPRDHGTIVQVGSALAYRGIPLQSAYCGAKHAIQGFTESLRCELLHEKSNVNITMVQLPAVNTPQFDWVLSRLRRQPQPVPPIYQPEVAAKSIVFAADHPRRREYWVGAPTVGTLLANRVVPGLLDHYLARTGYRSQQTDQPGDPDRPANLWDPADDTGEPDFGAHGSFDDRSFGFSPQLWLSQHRGLAAAGLASLAAATLAIRRRRS